MQNFRNSDNFPQNLFFLHILYHEADLSYRGGRHKGVALEIWQYFYIHYCKGIFKYIVFHKWEFGSPIWKFWLLFRLERNLTEQYSRAFGGPFLIFKTESI